MWKPHFKDMKEKAEQVSSMYEELVNEVGSKQAVIQISKKYNLAIGSVYRYLRATKTKLPKRVYEKKSI